MAVNLSDALLQARRRAQLQGRPLSSAEMGGITSGWADSASARLARARQLGIQEKGLTLDEQRIAEQKRANQAQEATANRAISEQMNAANKAAKYGGVRDALTTGATLYGINKWAPGATQAATGPTGTLQSLASDDSMWFGANTPASQAPQAAPAAPVVDQGANFNAALTGGAAGGAGGASISPALQQWATADPLMMGGEGFGGFGEALTANAAAEGELIAGLGSGGAEAGTLAAGGETLGTLGTLGQFGSAVPGIGTAMLGTAAAGLGATKLIDWAGNQIFGEGRQLSTYPTEELVRAYQTDQRSVPIYSQLQNRGFDFAKNGLTPLAKWEVQKYYDEMYGDEQLNGPFAWRSDPEYLKTQDKGLFPSM